MSWLRAGDNASTHPIVLRGGRELRPEDVDLTGPAGELVRSALLLGFVLQCALHSASHTTDYFVDDSVPWRMVGPAAPVLAAAAAAAGYWTRCDRPGVAGWQLVQDPEFIHLVTRAEKEWERQRRADSANPALTVPVRRRDGDRCRYCGQVVNWRARKGGRAGTYDHRQPGQPATVNSYVVCCLACNSGRRDDPGADARYPLLPVPTRPVYTPATVAYLAQHGVHVDPSDPAASGTPRPALRPGSQPENAPSDPAPGGTPLPAPPRQRTSAPDVHPAPPSPPRPAPPAGPVNGVNLQIPADPQGERRVGTGRDGPGTGRRGPGREPDPATCDPAALLAWCSHCQTETDHAHHGDHGAACLTCGTHRSTGPPGPRQRPDRPASPARRGRRGGRNRPRPRGSS